MAHPSQENFIRVVQTVFADYFINKTVLEIGSLDINGSNRKFFRSCGYVGVDVGPGLGVDLVCDGSELRFPDNVFDTVISTECFEHNPNWVKTFANMIRMCKPGGLVIMTCATEGRAAHGTLYSKPESSPLTVSIGWGDYYKNLTEIDFREQFDFQSLFVDHQFYTNNIDCDLYFWGIKS